MLPGRRCRVSSEASSCERVRRPHQRNQRARHSHVAARARPPPQRAARSAPPPAGLVDHPDRAPARPRARHHPRLPARPHRPEGQGPQDLLRRQLRALRRPHLRSRRQGPRSRHCQRCKPQSRARWTRETVRGAHRFWLERFGSIASSADWSGSHARRRGGKALKRYKSARWPSQSVIRRLYGTPAAARADAFAEPRSSVLTPPPPRSPTPRPQPPPGDDSRAGPVRAREDASVHGGRRAHAPSPRTATTATAPAGATPTPRQRGA